MAETRKPMGEFKEDSITVEIDAIAKNYIFDESLRGKWMLFFNHDYMDDMWAKAVELYSAGELPGIISIKTSTAAPCERSGTTEYGAIRFTCGPHTDRERILQYGQQLVKKMQYFNVDFGFVAYKTDGQSRIGTKATGATKNYLYRMPVPTYDHLKQRSGQRTEPPIKIPSRMSTRQWVTEVVGDYIEDPADFEDYARWLMKFPEGTHHDSAWVRACRLYRSGELEDVAYMQTSTAKPAPGKENVKEGVIFFYSRDNLSPSKLQQCGKNLVQKLNYSSRHGELLCRSYKTGRTWVVLCRVPTLEQ